MLTNTNCIATECCPTVLFCMKVPKVQNIEILFRFEYLGMTVLLVSIFILWFRHFHSFRFFRFKYPILKYTGFWFFLNIFLELKKSNRFIASILTDLQEFGNTNEFVYILGKWTIMIRHRLNIIKYLPII